MRIFKQYEKQKMKYKDLKGICKEAISNNICLGCTRLELETFEGVQECNYITRDKNGLKSNYEQIRIK